MIRHIGQVMLYVNDQDTAVKFWTEKIGFVVVADQEEGGVRWIEISPTKEAQTTLVLHNKEIIAKMQPELNLGTPSIMFYAEHIENLYQDFQAKGVKVGDLVMMPMGRVFNFADHENNYFALVEK
ncbi:VOC family protein [Lysinibacillus xylanilyticus]|uniref:VOC family protein n=1 Tax=Lysinibacillus xylanilyticus TaxID=582475 RepID=A0ABT4ELA1_9BACI|nr:VOC family protein [Lysinibacillus xylanilyticus]MCY9546293.1 VOC family protein [Lysinibacillus xylanilyticus]MED3801490.1 VOC family protein [Lysinibacillus xylanilyticus]